MAFKVQVGPPQIAIHQGLTVLVTEPDGQVAWPSNHGLYFRDTRVISAWAIYANGEPCSAPTDRRVFPNLPRLRRTRYVPSIEDESAPARNGLVRAIKTQWEFGHGQEQNLSAPPRRPRARQRKRSARRLATPSCRPTARLTRRKASFRMRSAASMTPCER